MTVKRAEWTAGLLLLAVSLIVCACGKKGDPIPQDYRYMFSWGETSAVITNDCLMITAQLEGAYENVESFLLEVEPTTGEICLDCPFKAGDVSVVQPTSSEGGLFSFQYCPENPVDSYRWRLVARNIYRGLPSALSSINLTVRQEP